MKVMGLPVMVEVRLAKRVKGELRVAGMFVNDGPVKLAVQGHIHRSP
jgi:hypothetical protein